MLDCGIIASRLQVNLDDLLWVLTDSQLKAALSFVNSLRDVVKKSTQQSKKLAAERLKKQGNMPSPVHAQAPPRQQTQKAASKSQQAMLKVFNKYDVKETSYHLYTGRIDLHLCDDAAPAQAPLHANCSFSSCEDEDHRRKVEGGAMQVTLFKMAVDYYPFHPAGGDRAHWLKYDENMAARDAWSQDLLAAFKEDVRRVRDAYLSPEASPNHMATRPDGPTDNSVNLGHSGQGQTHSQGQGDKHSGISGTPSHHHQQHNHPQHQHQHHPPSSKDSTGRGQNQGQGQGQGPTLKGQQPAMAPPKQTKLMESCFVCRLEDFLIYRVSTAADQRRSTPKKMLSSEKKQLLLPPEMSSVHAEFTDYYFPEGIDYPVPHANLFVVVNPIRLLLDYLSVVWLNAFALNLLKKADIPQSGGPKMHVDIKLDALMPKVILTAENEVRGAADRPEGLQVQVSRLTLTNCRIENKASLGELAACLDAFAKGRLFQGRSSFPSDEEDLTSIPDCFRRHINQTDSPYFDKTVESILSGRGIPSDPSALAQCSLLKKSESMTGLTYYNMTTESFKRDGAKDIWCVVIDQFWLEFVGVPSSRNRPVPFVESFPITIWIAKPVPGKSTSNDSLSSDLMVGSSQSEKSASCDSVEWSDSPGRPTKSRSRSSKKLLKEYYSLDVEGGLMQGSALDAKDGTDVQTSQSTPNLSVGAPPPTGERRRGGAQTPPPRLADLHVVTRIGAKVSAQINHYQFLFLMRLIETVTRYQTEIEEDTLFITKVAPAEHKVVMALLLKEAEVALVCPPIPELPSHQSSSPEDSEVLARDEDDDIYDAAAGHLLLDMPIREGAGAVLGKGPLDPSTLLPQPVKPSLNDLERGLSETSSSQDLSPDGLAVPQRDPRSNGLPPTEPSGSPKITVSDACGGGGGAASMTSSTVSGLSTSPQQQVSPLHQSHHQGAHHDSYGGSAGASGKKGNVDLKKSINSAFTSFTKMTMGKMGKQGYHGDEDCDRGDDWETMSFKSGSSDDEDYLMLKFQNATEAPAFESRFTGLSDDASVLELGSEARDMESASLHTLNASVAHAQGVVSVVSFKLHHLETVVQMQGKDVAVATQVDHLTPHEHGNINMDSFQFNFTTGIHETVSAPLPEVNDPPIKLRFQVGPAAELLAPTAEERGYLRALISNFNAKFLMSSLSNLGELIEDEKVPPTMPMWIQVQNSYITLKDDKLPTHIPSPGKVPIDLHITDLEVKRGEDGVMQIGAPAPVAVDLPLRSASLSFPLHLGNGDAKANLLGPQQNSLNNYEDQNHVRTEGRTVNGEMTKTTSTSTKSVWPTAADYEKLQDENDHLRRQLEKIGKMTTAEGGFNIEDLQRECEKWKAKAGELKALRKDSRYLLEQMDEQTQEMSIMQAERASLLATVKLLQDELDQSEQQRTGYVHSMH